MKMKKVKIFLTVCIIAVLSIFVCPTFIEVEASTKTPPATISTDGQTGEGQDSGGSSGGEQGESQEPEIVAPTFEGFAITTSVIWDEYLYSALLDIYSDYFESINGQEYTGSTIYSDMFKNFTTINLDKKNISNLEGLDKLELDNLETFSANSNAITEVKGSFFENTEDWTFTTLSLADNEIQTIDFTGLVGLNNINLSSNKLSNVDFSAIEGKVAGSTLTINLANNNFKTFDNIKLPTRRISHYNINIINNNITNIDDAYFDEKFSLNVGVQGFNVSDSVQTTDTANNLIYYKSNVENLSILHY